MFSKNEAKQLRQEFWISFGKSFPRNWILYNTNVKGLSFKFHFDTKTAYVALCFDMDPEKQTAYWDKIISHKSILESDFFADILFEKQFQVSDEKNLSAVVVSIKSKVSIHNKDTWKYTMEFLNGSMIIFEDFYTLYENTIKI
ncbi:DUF4268 domain-containing protein [Flavobacteriaceae bacterium]|nr:DUF4268 domain-containing protein [Flavobacteriaceae bacterium]MDA9028480.1 DUF4268 domain-containing protein [Flavobacteriaceae bacterium]